MVNVFLKDTGPEFRIRLPLMSDGEPFMSGNKRSSLFGSDGIRTGLWSFVLTRFLYANVACTVPRPDRSIVT